VGGVSAAVSKTAAAPIERVKLLIQNQVCLQYLTISLTSRLFRISVSGLAALGSPMGIQQPHWATYRCIQGQNWLTPYRMRC
jgi:hypothetical protein